jgi:hypothetical protein
MAIAGVTMKSFTSVGVSSICAFACLVTGVNAQREDPRHPNWDRYHNSAEAYALLDGWAGEFPNLTSLYSIGETLEGTQLWMLEITNKETGEALEKPGYYYDGNIHAGELTAAEVSLHFAWYLLNNYGTDARVTRLLDTRTLYVRPKFNPDGADVALNTLHNPRSTPRPYDEDADGLLDEDPPNDLDGDGYVTQMLVRNANGMWKRSAEDSRIIERRAIEETGGEFYDVYSEGVDDDGDGDFNEDDVGGIDMNRNFPRNWGLEFEQNGAGPFPLSEPETRATVEFLMSHRNITGIFHGHTSGGFLYRLPSTTSWDNYDMADQSLIVELAEMYRTTTGQPVRASYTNPRLHRHGTLMSWGYWDFGVVGAVPEFWGGFGNDYDGDGRVTELERLRWNEQELAGEGFSNWSAFEHPQLGAVEIGGWRSRFTRQNPPPHLLEAEIKQYVPWMLWLAEVSPRVVITDVSVNPIGEDGVFNVAVVIENEGYLPTNITQRALDAELAVPVRAIVDVTDAELVVGSKRTEVGHLLGTRDTQGRTGTADSRCTVVYVVRATGGSPRMSIEVRSEKGGVVRESIRLDRR